MPHFSPENLERRQEIPSENGWDISLERELIRESQMETMDWIRENAEKFREIIDENPEIIEEYQQDKEKTKTKVKELLDKKETIH